MKIVKLLAILFISALTLTGCEDDHDHDHDHEHEEEINLLRYTLTNTQNSSDIVILTFTDEDGEGGADGITDVSGALTANSSYTGVLELLHQEDDGEIEDISAEIAEDDAEDHQIFYITNAPGLSFNTTDLDANSNKLGFKTNASSGLAGSGALTISVIHEGKKPNNGSVADALSGNGTTDIEVSFNVTISE